MQLNKSLEMQHNFVFTSYLAAAIVGVVGSSNNTLTVVSNMYKRR